MFCPKCGNHSPDEASICPECGFRFGTISPQEAYYDPSINAYRQRLSTPASVPGKGLGITSMILGIISILISCLFYFSFPFSILGVVLGGYSMSKSKKLGLSNGCATAGVICSCISFGLIALFMIILFVTESNGISDIFY